MRLWVSIILLLFALPICLVAADPVELSVPVRVLGSPPPPEPMNMQPARPQPPPELPRFLSQYQSMRTFRIDRGQAPSSEQSTERFILALPDRPLLLEATITIDGQPYEMIREQRIDRLIAELKKPVREAPEPAPQEEPIVKTTAISEAVDEDETKNEQLDPDDEPAEDEGEETASETELEVALIAVPSTALAARLRRYATVTGRVPTRDEVRWLLNKWVDGPTLLLLDENFQRFRATQAPAFHVLDRDMDGKISADELKLAPQTLSSCDVNQNDVVEYTELAEVANDPRRPHVAAATQLLLPIQDAISVAQSFRRLARRYASSESLQRFDPNSDGVLDAAEIAKLKELKPDVAVSISFDSKDSTKSRITVTYTSPDLAINVQQIRIRGSSITIPIGGTLLEFSAVQTGALNGSDQISVGMINDGYPLLPAIDPNEDGRLTIRECSIRTMTAKSRPRRFYPRSASRSDLAPACTGIWRTSVPFMLR